MMKFCEACQNTGETIPGSGDLDCIAPGCTAATERTALNEWLRKNSWATGMREWAIYRRGGHEATEEAELRIATLTEEKAAAEQRAFDLAAHCETLERELADTALTIREAEALADVKLPGTFSTPEELFAAMEAAQSPSAPEARAPMVTVDTPEFRALVDAMLNEYWEPEQHSTALISHIDAHTAQAVAQAESFKQVEIDHLRFELHEATDSLVARLSAPQQHAQAALICWNCKKPYTAEQRAAADGNCPHCGVEIEIEDAQATLGDEPTAEGYAAVLVDAVIDEVMKERDHYHDIADGLADAIAKYFDVDIGEHSSANCPWDEALRIIEEPPDFASQQPAAAPSTPAIGQGPDGSQSGDDFHVEQFAKAMSAKMAKSRAKGRSGWDDPEQCGIEDLAAMLCQHVLKGDPVDIANFCMMLHQRDPEGEEAYTAITQASLELLAAAPATHPQESDDFTQEFTLDQIVTGLIFDDDGLKRWGAELNEYIRVERNLAASAALASPAVQVAAVQEVLVLRTALERIANGALLNHAEPYRAIARDALAAAPSPALPATPTINNGEQQ